MCEAALLYARYGLPVLPIAPGTKRPANRHGVTAATCDAARIERWWSAHPMHGVGIACGHFFDVLDFDSEEALERYIVIEDQRGTFTEGPVVLTSRGAHVYVLAAGENPKKTTIPGLDYRGLGAYVVAPPSIHASGHMYAFLAECAVDIYARRAPAWVFPHLTDSPRPTFEPRDQLGNRPGDWYNGQDLWRDLLISHGWAFKGQTRSREAWWRPGKRRDELSATWNGRWFYVFSTAAETAPLEVGPYAPFHLFAVLECGGSWTLASDRLRQLMPADLSEGVRL